jgi:hypothetical protein
MVKRKITNPCWDSNPPVIQPVTEPYTTELPRLLCSKVVVVVVVVV